MTPQVFAADPGLTSGFAYWSEPGVFWPGQCREMELSDRLEGWLRTQAELGCPAVVAYESFTITAATAAKSPQPWSLELIGTARWLCSRFGAEFVLQKPSEAKSFCPDARLRALGLYVPGQDHARDALRHLVLRLAKLRLIDVAPL